MAYQQAGAAWPSRAVPLVIAVFVAAFTAVVLCACLSGCRSTDALTETIYDQAAEEVDADNQTKVLRLDPDGIDDDQIQELEITPADMVRTRVQDDPLYGDESSDEKADASQYQEVSDYHNEATDATQGDGEEDGRSVASSQDDEQGDGMGTGGDQENLSGGTDGNGGNGGAGLGGDQLFYDTSLDPQTVPSGVHTIAATGQAAVLVRVIAGEGTLVATGPYTADDGVCQVFPDLEAVAAQPVFDADENVDLDALLSLDSLPDALVLLSSQYTLDDDQTQALAEAGVTVVLLPSFTSDDNICDAVRIVGEMCGCTDRADEYLAYHDMVLERALNGREVAGYSTASDSSALNVAYESTGLWTIYLADWDPTARYYRDVVDSSDGVALAVGGDAWSPFNYYLNVGGIINTAASYGSVNTVYPLRILWQFSDTALNHIKMKFTGDVTEIAEDISSFGSWNAIMTKAKDGKDLGDEGFDTLIAADRDTAERMLAEESKETNSLYRTYPVFDDGMRGFSTDSGPVQSSISGHFDVVVNPSGLLSSWTDGSLEGFLEAAWVAQEFSGGYNGDLSADIQGFYQEFYGVSVNVDLLLEGLDDADDGIDVAALLASYEETTGEASSSEEAA